VLDKTNLAFKYCWEYNSFKGEGWLIMNISYVVPKLISFNGLERSSGDGCGIGSDASDGCNIGLGAGGAGSCGNGTNADVHCNEGTNPATNCVGGGSKI